MFKLIILINLLLQPVGFVTFSSRASAEVAKQDLQVSIMLEAEVAKQDLQVSTMLEAEVANQDLQVNTMFRGRGKSQLSYI